MKTPCVKICQIDEQTRQCLGCGRTLREIGGWTSMSDARRDQIMAELPARMAVLRASGKA